MTISPGNAQDIGARKDQQDAFGFSDPTRASFVKHAGVVAVVADGMGGLAHGDKASKAAVHSFLQAYEAKSPSEPVQESLQRCLMEANRAVCSLAAGAASISAVGTTLAAAVVHDGHLHWVSVGDSRVYLIHEGRAVRMTRDHIYLNELEVSVNRGRMSRADAMQHPGRGDLTSYLGLPDLTEIDRSTKPRPVGSKDLVLVCTDGLYRALSDEEIAASLRNDPHGSCEFLLQRALAKRQAHQDNITVVALKQGTAAAALSRRWPKAVAAALTACAIVAGAGGVWWYQRQGTGGAGKSAQVIPDRVGGGAAEPGGAAEAAKEAPHSASSVAPEKRSLFGDSSTAGRKSPTAPAQASRPPAGPSAAAGSSRGAGATPLLPSDGVDLAPPPVMPRGPGGPPPLPAFARPAPRPPRPVISRFVADKTEVAVGKPVHFTWDIAGEVTEVRLNDKIVAKPTEGGAVENPLKDTRYRLIVKGPGGTADSQEIHVLVLSGPVRIVSFVALPKTVTQGASTLLQWHVEGASEKVTLDGKEVPRVGEQRVTIDKSTEFKLVASGDTGGIDTLTRPVTVKKAVRPAEILKFKPDVGKIVSGQKITLRWQTKGSVSRIILNGKLLNAETLSCDDYPTRPKEYELVIQGPPGTEPARFTASVDVSPDQKPPAKKSRWSRARDGLSGAGVSTCENPPPPIKR